MRIAVKSSPRGFSLIEVLIAIALILGIFSGAAFLLHGQIRNVRKMKVKLELLSLQLSLQRSLSSRASCQQSLGGIRIDESLLGTPGYGLPMNQIVEAGPPVVPILVSHQPLTGLSADVRIGAIRAVNIVKTAPDSFTADFVAPASAEGSQIHSFSFSHIKIQTDPSSPANAKLPVGCDYGPASGGGFAGPCRTVEAMGVVNLEVTAFCAPDEALIGGGGICVRPDGSDWDEPAVPPNGEGGYIHYNRMIQAGPVSGWLLDCFNPSPAGDFVRSRAVAYCCRR